ncbi:MAG: GntR family transcriptional regulator [Lachnospiraceae bacterium]|nr:GntR family transcriptional regulator [Lachnospiraceae bacterium]
MADNTIKSRIYNAIWDDIIDGVYDWNYVFNEKNLVEMYQVSKSPVRDALLELCKDNILRSIPRYGYEIVRIPEKQLREMIEMRVMIETSGIRKCFSHLKQKEFDAIREANLRSRILLMDKNSTARQLWEDNMGYPLQASI